MRNLLSCIFYCAVNFYLLLLPSSIHGFNLDLESRARLSNNKNGTWFGFSIALHKYNGNFVIVGAPKEHIGNQKNVLAPGAVHKCHINADYASQNHIPCYYVPFDSKENERNDEGDVVESKNEQWLGATVSSGGEGGPVVACAPRYVFLTMQPKRTERIEPVGTCFTATSNLSSFTEYSPCRTNYWGYHRQGSCQAGFSAAISKKGDRLFVGAPGSWYWQGQIYSIPTEASYPFKPPLFQEYGTGARGQAHSYDITDRRKQVYSTGESYSSDDDSYLGYSMTTGDFNGDGEEDVAVGMPRGAGLVGKVSLFNWKAHNFYNFSGYQIGAYFGYSLCTVDVDGDKLDDLIIGAPMFAEYKTEKYDVGRVYIKRQIRNGEFEPFTTIDGVSNGGRFGLALTTLGDVNRDGFGDFAVGAPYDGKDGHGVVYIYHGSKNGPREKASQIISAESVNDSPTPRTFGFSLAGGVDLDGNKYPDLAIGAYESDKTYLIKSSPVVSVDSNVELDVKSKVIDIENKNCNERRNDKRTCVWVKFCLTYGGQDVPEVLDFEIDLQLDSKKNISRRMYFEDNNNYRNITKKKFPVKIFKDRNNCTSLHVYLLDGIKDKLTPLEVEMKYDVKKTKRNTIGPVIDQNREVIKRDSINIQKQCGEDNICYPDLQLTIQTVNEFKLGSQELLDIYVTVFNDGEGAYEAAFYMLIPGSLDYVSSVTLGDSRDKSVKCTTIGQVVKCDLGNPFNEKAKAVFKISLKPSHDRSITPGYDLFMEANSTNQESNGKQINNILRKTIQIETNTEINIEGNSFPDYVHFQASDYKSLNNATSEADLGPQVVHIYNIRNDGTSLIKKMIVQIFWPSLTNKSDDLMYLLNQPETHGNIECEGSVQVNRRRLTIDPKMAKKSYLVQLGAIVKSSNEQRPLIEQSVDRKNLQEEMYKKQLTETKKKEFQEKDLDIASAGDASNIHSERAKTAQEVHSSSFSTSNGFHVDSNPKVFTNRTVFYGPDNVHETSTAYYGNTNEKFAAFGNQPNQQGAYSQNYIGSQNRYPDTNSDSYFQKPHLDSSRSSYGDYPQGGKIGEYYHQNPTVQIQTPGAGHSRNEHYSITQNSPTSTRNEYRQGNTYDRASLEKEAQGEAGLRTVSLDVDFHGVGRNNELGQSTSSQQNYQHQNYRSGQHSDQHLRQNTNDNYPTVEYHDFKVFQEPVHVSGHRVNQEHNANIRSNIQHDKNFQRLKRDTHQQNEKLISPCKIAHCDVLTCIVKDLESKGDAWIAIRTRLVAETLEKLSTTVPINISTMAISHITELPFIGAPKQEVIKSREIFFKAIPKPIPGSDGVPLWVVVLSACVGTIILLLLILLLYKCGFFKRNRPSGTSQERQPLNSRNGYHGDEHL